MSVHRYVFRGPVRKKREQSLAHVHHCLDRKLAPVGKLRGHQ